MVLIDRDTSLVDLADVEGLTVRALNVCMGNGIMSLGELLEYHQTNGTFTTIRNCGTTSSKELIKICEKYRLLFIAGSTERTGVSAIFAELDPFRKSLVHKYIKQLASSLSARGQNMIGNLSPAAGDETEIDRIFSLTLDFYESRNVGEKTVNELERFKIDLGHFIVSISKVEKEAIAVVHAKLIIQGGVPGLLTIPGFDLDEVVDKRGRIRLFKMIWLLAEQGRNLNGIRKRVFFSSFEFGCSLISNGSVASALQVSTERVRQIRDCFVNDLPGYFGFIKSLDPGYLVDYGVNLSSSFCVIDEAFAGRINRAENVSFNPLFYCLIFNAVFDGRFTILRYDECRKGLRQWGCKRGYLISSDLMQIFDFETFVFDLDKRLSAKIGNTYTLDFVEYLAQFYRKQDADSQCRDAIEEICARIIVEEFEDVPDADGNLRFERNQRRSMKEYVYEILASNDRLMTLDEIYRQVRADFPGFPGTRSSIRSAVIYDHDLFICIGKTSTYGLKRWESEKPDVRGGTVGDLAEEFLSKESSPKHFSEIVEYVLRFRKTTNAKNIISNIKLDKSDRFVFYKGGFLGLNHQTGG